jgi:hypothetical protein
MPEEQFLPVAGDPPAELAARFNVPVEPVDARLDDLAAEHVDARLVDLAARLIDA